MNYSPTSLSYNINWKIKNDPVYRIFDNKKWLDNFFEKGELMISCFTNFKNYDDEMQGDKTEGNGIIGGVSEDGEHHEYVIYDSGSNAYIMSTTMELNEKVISDFNGVCAIKINFPTLFGLEISKKLPFVNSGVEGKCDYLDFKGEILKKNDLRNKKFQELDFKSKSYLQNQTIIKELTRDRELFSKDKKYEHQNEYRLAWFSKYNVENSIVVECPEAIGHCEKIIF
ncbi:hypothetical protein KO506_06785 [Polaribacter vadi]|uniref:hypothetical protein n=1 Tax=Polaribacter TaxID=52959 RepID=UPI001C09EBBD|nr:MULTISPECIES: hypothetical protein [Polaribacter]MBU3011101.1 hypothetical protein [Polaribacter vadi]MDO6740915.1 hypothetical protein [Polaribacter sp. 1_MG-2023]